MFDDWEELLGRVCGWCMKPLDQPVTGRRKSYCDHACRQRAYAARRMLRAVQDFLHEREQVEEFDVDG